MTVRISQHDLWGAGGTRVATLSPGRDDLFVVVMIEGRVAACEPVTEYQRMVWAAERLVRRVECPRPITIKVLSMTGHEAMALGLLPRDLFRDQTPAQDAEMRRVAISTCMAALRTSPDPVTRSDALDLLKSWGAIQ